MNEEKDVLVESLLAQTEKLEREREERMKVLLFHNIHSDASKEGLLLIRFIGLCDTELYKTRTKREYKFFQTLEKLEQMAQAEPMERTGLAEGLNRQVAAVYYLIGSSN